MPSDKEIINHLIDSYTNLQRIKKASDTQREIEIDYQLSAAKAKLESFGIVTENLDTYRYQQ